MIELGINTCDLYYKSGLIINMIIIIIMRLYIFFSVLFSSSLIMNILLPGIKYVETIVVIITSQLQALR